MKKFIIMGIFAVLSTTLFSCTADEYETTTKKTEVKKDNTLSDGAQADVPQGPGDDPVGPNPPKK